MAIQLIRPDRQIVRWDPVREMSEMERRLRGTLDDMFDWGMLPTIWSVRDGFWAPSIELLDKGDKYVARAELPGMSKEEIGVSVGDEGLMISGERKREKDVKEEDYVYREHTYGSFRRVIPLPVRIDPEKVTASYHDGILEVALPKGPEAKSKKVEIGSKTETTGQPGPKAGRPKGAVSKKRTPKAKTT